MKPSDQKTRQQNVLSESSRHIYLDVCALCRPFDDQNQIRIRLETEAVQLILSHVRSGNFVLILSPAHQVEIGAIEDRIEREHLASTLRKIGRRVEVNLDRIRERAERLADEGLGPADAAHLAFAEATGADFVSCDDRLLHQCRRVQSSTWSGTPVAFCEKENLK
jgi:predicted nucleic acid-binding protein